MADLKLREVSDGFDIVVENGDLLLCESEISSIEQNGLLAIMTQIGDNVYHDKLGNSIYTHRIPLKQASASLMKELCVRAVKSSDSRINSITRLDILANDEEHDKINVVLNISESDIVHDIDNYEEEETGDAE